MTIKKLKWEQPAVEIPFDYDAATGIKQWFSMRADGSFQLRQEMAVDNAEIEASKALAKSDEHWDDGVKGGFLHYAHIPDSILFMWHTMGVNINEPGELFNMANRPEWRYLKCVDKIHVAKE